MKRKTKFKILFVVLAILMVVDIFVLVSILRDQPAQLPPTENTPAPTPTQEVQPTMQPTPSPAPESTLVPLEPILPEGFVPVESITIYNRSQVIGDDSFAFLSNRTESMMKGQLVALVEPRNADYPTVYWSSGNESVVRVSSTGEILGVGNGTAYITATADNVSTSIRVLVEKSYDADTFWQTRYAIGYLHPIRQSASIATVASVGGDYWFNSERHTDALNKSSTTRSHAGFDLNVPAGTNIYAMFDGTVEHAAKDGFYAGTGSITILHDDGAVARYAEVTPVVTEGRVKRNQLIAVVAENDYGALAKYGGMYQYEHMLHIEVYFGFDPLGNVISGSLSDKSSSSYYYAPTPRHGGSFFRRADLVDPTRINELPQVE